MSNNSISNDVIAAMRAMSAKVGHLDAQTGAAPDRPPAGINDCFVTGIDLRMEDFTWDRNNPAARTAGLIAQINYTTIDALPGQESPLEFPGQQFRFPLDPGALPQTPEFSGKRKQVEIAIQRFKGLLFQILGRDAYTNDLAADAAAVTALINGDNRVIVRLRSKYTKGKPKPGQAPSETPQYYEEAILARTA